MNPTKSVVSKSPAVNVNLMFSGQQSAQKTPTADTSLPHNLHAHLQGMLTEKRVGNQIIATI
jgi:hypothetical protein